MAYDALSDFADQEELHAIRSSHRLPLLVIGTVSGAMGTLPGMMWLGGVLSVIFFPLLAAVAIWLYLLVFVFSGLWFQHYCLDALVRRRSTFATSIDPDRVMDAEPPGTVQRALPDDRQKEE